MLRRWEPAREIESMQDAMDRMWERLMPRNGVFTPRSGMTNVGSVDVDVYQDKDALMVKANVPGIKPENVHVELTGDALTLRGEMEEEREEKREGYFIKERGYGSFFRSLSLPPGVDAEKAEADFENGVLTIRIPKAEASKAKQIPVKSRAALSGQQAQSGQRQPSSGQQRQSAA